MGIQKNDPKVLNSIFKCKVRKNVKQVIFNFDFFDFSKNSQITFYRDTFEIFDHPATNTNDERYLFYSSLSPPINS
jgi:hypothetical protein